MTDSPDEPDLEKVRNYKRPVMPFERKAEGSGKYAMASVGIEFGLLVVLFFLGGRWLDGKFGTEPWLGAAGGLLGVALGMYRLIRGVTRFQDRPSQTEGSGKE